MLCVCPLRQRRFSRPITYAERCEHLNNAKVALNEARQRAPPFSPSRRTKTMPRHGSSFQHERPIPPQQEDEDVRDVD
eukprot:8359598-Prorocentrum_lima.AAC.1